MRTSKIVSAAATAVMLLGAAACDGDAEGTEVEQMDDENMEEMDDEDMDDEDMEEMDDEEMDDDG